MDVGTNKRYGADATRRPERVEVPEVARHVWVRQSRATDMPPAPGLLLEWRWTNAARWEGLVAYSTGGSVAFVVRWVAADDLLPAR